MKRSHTGIAETERKALGLPAPKRIGHAAAPSVPDPRRATCTTCGRPVHFVRRTYGPNARAGHWQHTGDGLAQFRAW